jgi:hypothetical protein
MAVRLGIELSPHACRIVEIEGAPSWGRLSGTTRVRSFMVLPPSGAETDAAFASLRGRRAAVIVWNAPGEHRQVVVTGGPYESMRAEAVSSLAAAGLPTDDVLADIAPAAGTVTRGTRQPVLVVLAPIGNLVRAIEPLRLAGIFVRTIVTPAAALGSLAHLRRQSSIPGAVEAYVALEPSMTCVALVRDGVLVAARDLPWGFAQGHGASATTRPRDEIAMRLSADIADFIAAIGGEPREVGQVCVVGGLPELRSMTAEMMDHLDVEVEPLDSMSGIDIAHLPEPADEFRDRSAELRLAWAMAADWPPTINLLRARRRRESRAMLSRAAIGAGIAAGLLIGWRVEESPWWQSRAPTAAIAAPQSQTAAGARDALAAPPPAVAAETPAPAAPPLRPTLPSTPPPPLRTEPARSPSSTTARATLPSSVAQDITRDTRQEPRQPAGDASFTRPPAPTAESAQGSPSATRPRAPSAAGTKLESTSSPASAGVARAVRVRPAPPETPQPFDASLGTILFSPDRKLAIVDGRIVAVGDEVRGARVVEITPTAVLLKDSEGKLRQLALGPGRQ